MADDLVTALGAQRYISLTSFKKNGDGVATVVWIARDGDRLIVLAPEESWKVKRVRNNPHVTLVPSGQFGKVSATDAPVDGMAEVVTDPAVTARLWEIIRRKYGFEYRVIMLIERIAARRQKPRVILRITVPTK
jgi:hypothetical protein